MNMIEVTAYGECLTNAPRPFKIIINFDLISALNRLDVGWTSVWLGGGPQNIQMKGEPREVLAELVRTVRAEPLNDKEERDG